MVLRQRADTEPDMTVQPGFTFCICPDSALLRQQIDLLLTQTPGAASWERHVFWGDEELSRQFWDQLTLQGLFSSARALIVRHAHNLPPETWKRLSSALARPNPQVWPILCLEGPWEKGQPKLPAAIAKLPCLNFADAKGWVWRAPGLDARSLRRYVQTRAKALGLAFAADSLDILCAGLPAEAAAVDSELNKLLLLTEESGGKRRPVTTEDLHTLAGVPEFNVFTLLKNILAGQSREVWRALLAEQAKGEEPLFYLLAMLQREARQLWQVAAGEQTYLRPAELPAKKQAAARLGAPGLAALWDAMHAAEFGVKSGRISPGQALDNLIGSLTLLFSGEATQRRATQR